MKESFSLMEQWIICKQNAHRRAGNVETGLQGGHYLLRGSIDLPCDRLSHHIRQLEGVILQLWSAHSVHADHQQRSPHRRSHQGEAQALRALDDHNRHVPLLDGLLIHCAAGHGRLGYRHVFRSASDRLPRNGILCGAEGLLQDAQGWDATEVCRHASQKYSGESHMMHLPFAILGLSKAL